MLIFKKGSILMLLVAISGCVSTPAPPIVDSVDNNEVLKYEKKYLSEYELLKSNYSDQSIIKWVQPSNKKSSCKVYVGTSKVEDRTLDENYKIYWDGGCKNGYANGLGREFERGTILNMEALAIYQGKKEEPQYFVQKYYLDNKTQEGDINNGYYVETTINEDNFNFNIAYQYGYFGSIERPALLTRSSPFSDDTNYSKLYPNFSYSLWDMSRNEFETRKYQFDTVYNGQPNGFGFTTPKVGATVSGEANNGNVVRRVTLPNDYFQYAALIQSDIKEAGQKAINAQKYALKVKKQYLSKICKDSVKVAFINNDKYKEICNEGDYYVALQKKMDVKLAQINQLKQQKRDQLNQQQLINAQVSQANAAQRQANAAARSASAAEQANSMQSWQNINNNLQMQQLNSNLMFMRMGL